MTLLDFEIIQYKGFYISAGYDRKGSDHTAYQIRQLAGQLLSYWMLFCILFLDINIPRDSLRHHDELSVHGWIGAIFFMLGDIVAKDTRSI